VLAKLARTLLDGRAKPGDRILHAFIATEDPHPFRETGLKIGEDEATRLRVDSTDPRTSWMFHARWRIPDGDPAARRALAVPVRQLSTSTTLNTANWFPPLVADLAHSMGWTIMWFGGADGPPLGVTLDECDEYLAYRGKTLLDQIREVRARATAAVGWNSGGLDIAAAGGLPVLRIGEYQKHGPIAQPHLVEKYRWGCTYNSYLAVATNVGLAPLEIEADRFPQEIIRVSLATFLSRIDELSSARHVILPPGQALIEANLESLLSEHQVPWPA
jgi:hypothetical protein